MELLSCLLRKKYCHNLPCFYATFAFLLPPANEVWGKVIFSEACVKNSVHRGGSTWAGPPRPGTPPGTRHTPPGLGTPPGTRYNPWDQVHPLGPVHHPRDQVHPPAGAVHAARYEQQAGGMHLTGMHSCFWRILLRIWIFLSGHAGVEAMVVAIKVANVSCYLHSRTSLCYDHCILLVKK